MSDRRRPDHYTRRAKAAGMPARSVFKLEEIDRKHRLLRRGMRVLDLGCRPGSWSAYVRQQAGSEAALLGVDLHPVEGYPGTFLLQSVEALTPEQVCTHLGGAPDLVLSDMAPDTTGARDLDHLRQVALAEAALEVARRTLAPGGAFVCKVFDGRDAPAFVEEVRRSFAVVKRIRPQSTRKESREFFVLGQGYRPTPEGGAE